MRRRPELPPGILSSSEVSPTSGVPFSLAPSLGAVDGEDFERIVDWPAPGTGGLESVLFTTTGRWRAIDVYVQPTDALDPREILTVRIYAVISGARILVRSGRLGAYGTGVATLQYQPTWVAGARAQATRWEVTVAANGAIATPAGLKLRAWASASNEADVVPDHIGAIRMGTNGDTTVLGSISSLGIAFIPFPELLWISCAIDPAQATPLFVQVFDNSGGVAAGVPTWSFPIGLGTAGDGAQHIESRYRSQTGGLAVGVSSTHSTFTASIGTAALQCVIR